VTTSSSILDLSAGAHPDGPQLAIVVRDGGQVIGYVVIDSSVGGRSHGGARLRADVTLEEIALLARTMTLKYRYLGLPFGGAKAGVVGDPEGPAEERHETLVRFARTIKPLLASEVYVPAADMGTTPEDIRRMLGATGIRMGKRRLPLADTGRYTAISVMASSLTLIQEEGSALQDASVAVEGLGKVGLPLLEMLHAAGARIVAVSTSAGGRYAPEGLDIPEILGKAGQYGSALVKELSSGDPLEPEAVKTLPVDVLYLCANMHSIHHGNVKAVEASAICPAANNPWPESVEAVFDQRGVAYLPDFMANSGGILGSVMTYATFPDGEIRDWLFDLFESMTRLTLSKAKESGIPVRSAAYRVMEGGSKGERSGSQSRMPGGVLEWGLGLHRRGLVPGAVVRLFARSYFRRRFTRGLLV
jgi:glutamate dehydrogenase (NAD(P)+)